mmetsp:Transcript_17922/g.30484  ORF Transcript_17922/g.30484 Transcript_17922/m.30484 type:complete len:145 (-) Transcript_17922:227-661(-)
MSSFCKVGIFHRDMNYAIIERVRKELSEEESAARLEVKTLITLYLAHQTWSQQMVLELKNEMKNAQRKIFQDELRDFCVETGNLILTELETRELDLKGLILVLYHGYLPGTQMVRSKANTRKLHAISIAGFQIIKQYQVSDALE